MTRFSMLADQATADLRAAVAVNDRVAEAGTETTRAAILEAFERSTLCEWMFWDGAYRMERWPGAVRLRSREPSEPGL